MTARNAFVEILEVLVAEAIVVIQQCSPSIPAGSSTENGMLHLDGREQPAVHKHGGLMCKIAHRIERYVDHTLSGMDVVLHADA
jgi:hypothetical protein